MNASLFYNFELAVTDINSGNSIGGGGASMEVEKDVAPGRQGFDNFEYAVFAIVVASAEGAYCSESLGHLAGAAVEKGSI